MQGFQNSSHCLLRATGTSMCEAVARGLQAVRECTQRGRSAKAGRSAQCWGDLACIGVQGREGGQEPGWPKGREKFMCCSGPRHQSGVLFCFVFPCCAAFGILVPWPGTELTPSAVKARSPNHWTAREFPSQDFKFFIFLTYTSQSNSS